MSSSLSRRDIISLLKDRSPTILPSSGGYKQHVETEILQFFGLAKENLKDTKKFSGYCGKFAFDAKDYYCNESGSKIIEFLSSSRRKKFLDSIIPKPDSIEVRLPKKRPGAPKKEFCEKGPTGQNLEANDVKNYASCSGVLFKAAKLSADEEGLKDVSFVFKEVAKDPATATEMRAAITASKQGIS